GRRALAGALSPLDARVACLVAALIATEVAVSLAYMWGKPSQPASARLFIWLDTWMAFSAAWILTVLGRHLAARAETGGAKAGAATAIVLSVALFLMQVPVASEARFVNALIVTRQAAATWRFFARLGE